MTRTAERERSTAETQIRLSLDLDGGESSASTGVGFLDHMLDLLARHGRLGLKVEANGDLETGAHHTVEDVGIVLGQALDEALGDRAGIRRYGSAVVPMDESLAECAIDISGRPLCVFDAELPATSIAGFDTELAEEFFRAVANSAKLTLHVSRPLRDQRPPHDRGLLQGLRTRIARRRLDRSRGERRALDQGNVESSEHASNLHPRLRHGQPALGREGARARRRDGQDRQRPCDDPLRRRPDPPRRRRLPQGDGQHPATWPRRADRGAAHRRRAGPRHLPWPAASLRIDRRARRGDGPRSAAGRRQRPRCAGAEGPAHRLVAGSLGKRVARWSRGSSPRRPSTSSTPSPRGPSPVCCSARPPTATASPSRPRARASSASSSTPRSRVPPACACSRTSPASAPQCRRRRSDLDPLPGDRHPWRPGRTPAAGRLRARDDLRRRPGRRRTALGRGRSGVPARGRPRRCQGRRTEEPRARASHRRRGRLSDPGRRWPARARLPWQRCSRPAPSAW